MTITGGKGDDSIRNYAAASVSIDGGAGYDYIYNSGDNVTLSGGTGKDTISLSSGADNNLIKYKTGDGNDTIYGFNSTTTLQIDGGKGLYSTQVSGNDVIVKVGKGSIRLKNVYATADTLHINKKSIALESKSLKLPNANNSITVSRNFVSVVGNAGNDTIDNYGEGVTISGGSGDDEIYNGKDSVSIAGGAGDDSIRNMGYNVTINGGTGDDTISLGSYYTNNDLIQYKSGDGNDILYGFKASDTLNISGGTHSTTKSGSDIIVTVGKGKITLSGAATLSAINIMNSTPLTVTNKTKSPVTLGAAVKAANASTRTTAVKITGNVDDNSIIGGSGKDSLYGGAGDDSILGGAGNDKIYGQAGNDTLRGDKGNDSLWGGDGADKFIYIDGDGKDVIYGFDDTDMLLITGAFSASYSKSDKAVYFKVGSTDKAVTLKDFSATTFNVNGIDYKVSGSKLAKSS